MHGGSALVPGRVREVDQHARAAGLAVHALVLASSPHMEEPTCAREALSVRPPRADSQTAACRRVPDRRQVYLPLWRVVSQTATC